MQFFSVICRQASDNDREVLTTLQEIAKELYGGFIEGKPNDAIKTDASASKKLIEVKIVGDELHVTFPHWNGRQERVNRLKALKSGFQWDKYSQDKHWHGPVLLAGELVNLYPEGEFSDEVIELANRKQKLSAMSNKVASDFEVKRPKGTLRPSKGRRWSLVEAKGRGWIGDDMGLGRRSCCIHAALAAIAPGGDRGARQREDQLGTRNESVADHKERVVQLSGRGLQAGLVERYGVRYQLDIQSAWVDEILSIKPQLIVADELHYAKNQKSGRGAASRN